MAVNHPARSPVRTPPQAAEILLVFVTAVTLMVVVVGIVMLVDRWWVLIPAFLVAVLGVLGTINHLLADDD